MSAVKEDLEEGEITDSEDSMCEDSKLTTSPPVVKSIPLYVNASKVTSWPKPPYVASDESDSNSYKDDDYDSDETESKRSRYQRTVGHQNAINFTFVNPNFVENGSKMPPRPRNKDVWGSVMQEQLITQEVGGFSMEQKVKSDREIESYDYTRAKEDHRPNLHSDEIPCVQDDLFGEVIDLEDVMGKKPQNLKRKRQGRDSLVKGSHEKYKRTLPRKIRSDGTVEEVTYAICSALKEVKIHLIRRVVQEVGQVKAIELLEKTKNTEAAGGLLVNNGSRRRTPGGVYIQLLKTDSAVTKEQIDKIFEEEYQWYNENKKRKKARARQRKRMQQAQQTKPNGGSDSNLQSSSKSGVMEMDILPDQNLTHYKESSSDDSNCHTEYHKKGLKDEKDNLDCESKSDSDAGSVSSFSKELQGEIKRQADQRSQDTVEGQFEDVLDIEADGDII